VLSVCTYYLRYNNYINTQFQGAFSEVLSVCIYYLCYNNFINKHFQGASQKC